MTEPTKPKLPLGELVMVPIEELNPAPYNPRTIKREELERLEKSIVTFGFVDPIIANSHEGRENVVIGGHARLKVAKRLGRDRVPVVYVDETPMRERMLNIALNNPKLQGSTDEAKIAVLLKEIETSGADVTATGYSEAEVNKLIAKIQAERAEAKSRLERPKSPVTAHGDLYLIGDDGHHRLLCADSTDPKQVARLCGGLLAHCVFTDAPYGVDYSDTGHKRGGRFEKIENDELQGDDLVDFLGRCFRNAVDHTSDDAGFYIWHSPTTRHEFEQAMAFVGLEEVTYIIWAKDYIGLSRADYRSQYEPCFYAQKVGQDARWSGARDEGAVWTVTRTTDEGDLAAALANGVRVVAGGDEIFIAAKAPRGRKIRVLGIAPGETIRITTSTDESDVWEIKRDPVGTYEHPTQKPASLAARALRNSTKRGDIVLDLFGGSGSTLAGAEETGRRAFIVEKDPGYCDVIVARAERLGLDVVRADKVAK